MTVQQSGAALHSGDRKSVLGSGARKSAAIVLTISIIWSASVRADGFLDNFRDPEDGWIDGGDWLLNNAVGFLPVPIIVTEPATGPGLGVAGVFFHKPKEIDESKEFVLPSASVGLGVITENDTWIVGGGHMGIFKQDHIRYTGFLGFASINLKFYPGSQQAADAPGFQFNSEGTFIFQDLMFRLRESGWWLGVTQELVGADTSFDISEVIPGIGPFQAETTSSALGPTVKYESVDSVMTPSTGWKGKISYLRYSEAIASDFDSNKLELDLQSFWELPADVVLGIRLNGKYVNGEMPFYMLPFIDLRGIPALRYAGTDVVQGETEVRWDFHPRWSVIGFMGVGWAANRARDLSDASSRVTQGIGFRYYAARVLGLRAGIDFAKGPEDSAVYLTIGSAWR